MTLGRSALLGTTMLAALAVWTVPAAAQTPSDVDEIVVTGSRIRRDPANSPTPLIQVQREELLTSGQSTLIDFLATVPALYNSQVPSDTTGSLNIAGVSLANLRSLGTGRTLTLVDGRRHVGSLQGNLAVDIDTIPRLLIQDIEIVTGGASSVYGADAVSGVLNFRLRRDFEGVEVDANYGQINSEGQTSKRFSGLVGHNFLGERLNVYGFFEKENADEVRYADLKWAQRGAGLVGNDVDIAGAADDGNFDNILVYNQRTLSRLPGGVVYLANSQQPSATSSPNVPVGACPTGNFATNCFNVDPSKTYVFDAGVPRLANLGTFRSQTGLNRTINVGGDGVNPNTDFGTESATPKQESDRYQAGLNFALNDAISLFGEVKYVDEVNQVKGQNSFADIFIQSTSPTSIPLYSGSQFITGLDNALIPGLLRTAILTNVRTNFGAPTATAPGQATSTVLDQRAVNRYFGPERLQVNERQVTRYVVGMRGERDELGFAQNVSYEASYTYGKMKNLNIENGIDYDRFGLAVDAVVDTAGRLGQAGAIVCRSRLLAAQGLALAEFNPKTATTTYTATDPTITQCAPLNVFGDGQQSAAALAYTTTAIRVRQKNEQQNAIASISGNLWDFWGAGRIGAAVGVEYRKEETQGIGRSADTGTRNLQLNTGPDFAPASYEAREVFAELRIPLIEGARFAELAELSGSYRYSDYSSFGGQDVYGVNLLFRPIRDITFKASYNASIRIPNLAETNAPATQTFLNNFSDPCDARVINNLSDRVAAQNRIANCRAISGGLSLNFSDINAANAFLPIYSSGIAGANQGNPNLQPESSDSYTMSLVLQPRFVPRLTVALDYYQITIDNVISSVTAANAAVNCVSQSAINTAACQTLTRSPTDFRLTTFIQGSINYAGLETRGLDFTVDYSNKLPVMFGHEAGRFDYSLRGLYLIQQRQYVDLANPGIATNLDSLLFYPRVRLSSSLTYHPTRDLSVNWTMDYQTANEIVDNVLSLTNGDNRDVRFYTTGDFARHDFTVRYAPRDFVSLRAGVVNAFDKQQAPYLGGTLYSNFDPFGRRFFVGLNIKY